MSAVKPLAALSSVDRMIHEPARLMVLSILAGAASVEFRFVLELTGLTKGNLSSHMAKLEGAGLVTVDKSFRGKVPVTTLSMTDAGRTSLRTYRERLAAVVESIPLDSSPRHAPEQSPGPRPRAVRSRNLS